MNALVGDDEGGTGGRTLAVLGIHLTKRGGRGCVRSQSVNRGLRLLRYTR